MVSPPRHPRGQQRDKIYREALRLELADMSDGVDLKKLREIARAHIEKAAAGDMQAIKELRDTLDGKPVQQLEHDLPPDSAPGITKIVHEFVHRTAEQALELEARNEALELEARNEEPLEITFVRSHEIGNGGLNEDTARTKR
jgi:hypothetical protein